MPTLSLADCELHYEDHGTGEPLLLLHGLGGSGRDWAPQITRFAATHRVLVCDVCGHGKSSKPPGPYSIAGFGRHAAELLRRVASGPAHVVGLSMGGMIAFQLAVDAPELVRSLVIVNSGPELVPRNLQERWALWMRVMTVRWLGLPKMAAVLAPRLFPGPELAAERQAFVEQFVANDPVAYLAALKALIGWRVTDRIGGIRAPTLVVASELDYTPASRKEEYARRMPNARLVVVPDAHHALPMELPDRFDRVLASWLSEQAAAPAPAGQETIR